MINHLEPSTSDRKSLINTESLKGVEFYLQRKDDRSSLHPFLPSTWCNRIFGNSTDQSNNLHRWNTENEKRRGASLAELMTFNSRS